MFPHVIKQLKKTLEYERNQLRYQDIVAADRKYAETVRMAKERIPEYELAIDVLTKYPKPDEANKPAPSVKKDKRNQLNLFDLFK